TWEYLKEEFYRKGADIPDAKYYETFGPGPKIFAVADNTVYYHHENVWIPYTSAFNISYGIMKIDE
ncbi:unnamed protein product, partial [Rotaria magnacalcarata]